MAKANAEFEVLLTADRNLRFQQNLTGLDLVIVVFPSNRLGVVKELAPRLREILPTLERGALFEL